MDNTNTFYPASQVEWRKWLMKNHQSSGFVWLIFYRVATGIPSLTWSEAVDEALAFGWIDSTKRKIDDTSYMQYFCKRKPQSTWSKVNKQKVEQLIQNGKMTQAGLDVIEIAKENGNWSLMDEVEDLIVPTDLAEALKAHLGAMDFFEAQTKSMRKGMLYWIVTAKRATTRQKRIQEVTQAIAQGQIPKRFRT